MFLTLACAGSFHNDTVDVYDDATGLWSTALLSVPRSFFAATSVGELAIFAGGQSFGALFLQKEMQLFLHRETHAGHGCVQSATLVTLAL